MADILDIESLILHRDANLLVLNKPANIAVHPGFGDGNTLDRYFPALQFGLPNPPQLAHRLDRATSGCLVLGRHAQALKRLAHLFATQAIAKTYLAVVVGNLSPVAGRITLKLAKKDRAAHRWWMCVDEQGQEACTDYEQVASNGVISVVRLMPKTGRTHQLRVHMAAIGHPILGEWMYHQDIPMPEQCMLQLHASHIAIPYYDKKPIVNAKALLPAHMQERVEAILCIRNAVLYE